MEVKHICKTQPVPPKRPTSAHTPPNKGLCPCPLGTPDGPQPAARQIEDLDQRGGHGSIHFRVCYQESRCLKCYKRKWRLMPGAMCYKVRQGTSNRCCSTLAEESSPLFLRHGLKGEPNDQTARRASSSCAFKAAAWSKSFGI